MEVNNISKDRLGAKVLFPRTQLVGLTDFMVLFSGSRDGQQVTQANHEEVYRRICVTQDAAARWWHVYGKGDI